MSLIPSRNLGYIRQEPYGSKATRVKDETFSHERSKAIKAAEDLGYGEECVERLESAGTRMAIGRIMAEYRRKRFG